MPDSILVGHLWASLSSLLWEQKLSLGHNTLKLNLPKYVFEYLWRTEVEVKGDDLSGHIRSHGMSQLGFLWLIWCGHMTVERNSSVHKIMQTAVTVNPSSHLVQHSHDLFTTIHCDSHCRHPTFFLKAECKENAKIPVEILLYSSLEEKSIKILNEFKIVLQFLL